MHKLLVFRRFAKISGTLKNVKNTFCPFETYFCYFETMVLNFFLSLHHRTF